VVNASVSDIVVWSKNLSSLNSFSNNGFLGGLNDLLFSVTGGHSWLGVLLLAFAGALIFFKVTWSSVWWPRVILFVLLAVLLFSLGVGGG